MAAIIPFVFLFLSSFIPAPPLRLVDFEATSALHYSLEDKEKLTKAMDILDKAINGKKFQNRFMLTHFTETNHLSNRQILEKLTNGFNNSGAIHVTMVEFNEPFSNVIGYVDLSLPGVIFQNRKWMWNEYIMAANILHESLHLLGFLHENEKEMETSVPYAAQNLLLEVLDRPQDMI